MMARSLEDAGIPLDRVADALRNGTITLDFLDAPVFDRFASLADETFQDVSDRTGVPLELLLYVREAIGLAAPSAGDRMREDELAIVPFLELQVESGF